MITGVADTHMRFGICSDIRVFHRLREVSSTMRPPLVMKSCSPISPEIVYLVERAGCPFCVRGG